MLDGAGFSAAKLSAGRYRVTFDVAFPNMPTVVVTKVYGNVTADAGNAVRPLQNAIVDQIQETSVLIATCDDAGAKADSTFCFIALGPT